MRRIIDATKGRGGSRIWFPAGYSYLLRDIDCTGLSNVTFDGVRGASILQYHRSGAGSNDSMFEWNGASKPAQNARNIVFQNLTMRGDGALAEHQALVFLSAVDDVLIDNMEFLNMQGDAVNVARTAVGGVDSGVHNNRVRVRHSLFDGIDRRGRNGISSMDIDGLTVESSTFRRLAAPSMPGAIDLEPNIFDTTAIVRNVDIFSNVFEDNGGNIGDVTLAFVPTTGSAYFENINVHDNQFRGTRARNAVHMEWHQRGAQAADLRKNINVYSNTIGAPSATPNVPQEMAIEFMGIKGFSAENNEVTGWERRAVGGGLSSISMCREGSVKRNRFVNCGTTVGYVVNFDYIHDLDVDDNYASSSTTVAAFVGIMQGYDVSGTRMRNNDLKGISDALFTSAAASAAQTNAATNFSYGNKGVSRQLAVAAFATGRLVSTPITGSRGGNAVVASLLSTLDKAGIITDSTTA